MRGRLDSHKQTAKERVYRRRVLPGHLKLHPSAKLAQLLWRSFTKQFPYPSTQRHDASEVLCATENQKDVYRVFAGFPTFDRSSKELLAGKPLQVDLRIYKDLTEQQIEHLAFDHVMARLEHWAINRSAGAEQLRIAINKHINPNDINHHFGKSHLDRDYFSTYCGLSEGELRAQSARLAPTCPNERYSIHTIEKTIKNEKQHR